MQRGKPRSFVPLMKLAGREGNKRLKSLLSGGPAGAFYLRCACVRPGSDVSMLIDMIKRKIIK